jgi:hypothetical protein
VVIADRGASTTDPLVQEWNKMALHALSLPRPREAFEPLRSSMSKFLKVSTGSRKIEGKALKKIPKIVYVDRQDTSRRLVDDDHEELVEYLKKMEKKGKIEFVHGKFGSLGLRDQVKSVLDADVRYPHYLISLFPINCLPAEKGLGPNRRGEGRTGGVMGSRVRPGRLD